MYVHLQLTVIMAGVNIKKMDLQDSKYHFYGFKKIVSIMDFIDFYWSLGIV